MKIQVINSLPDLDLRRLFKYSLKEFQKLIKGQFDFLDIPKEKIKPAEEKKEELEKPNGFLEKLVNLIPKRAMFLVGGLSLLVAVETKDEEKTEEYVAPQTQEVYFLEESPDSVFSKKFDFSLIDNQIEHFVLIKGPNEIINDLTMKGDELSLYEGDFYRDKETTKAVLFINEQSDIKKIEKILSKHKEKIPSLNFKIDRVETKRNLEIDDYYQLFKIFFNKDVSYQKALTLVDKVNIKAEETKASEKYGVDAYIAASFSRKNRKSSIVLQKSFIENKNI